MLALKARRRGRPRGASAPRRAAGRPPRAHLPPRARTNAWVLEFESDAPPEIDPLMGWTGGRDTRQQVRLAFPTRERAEAFAKGQGWDYTVWEPHPRRPQPRGYADNFRKPPG